MGFEPVHFFVIGIGLFLLARSPGALEALKRSLGQKERVHGVESSELPDSSGWMLAADGTVFRREKRDVIRTEERENGVFDELIRESGHAESGVLKQRAYWKSKLRVLDDSEPTNIIWGVEDTSLLEQSRIGAFQREQLRRKAIETALRDNRPDVDKLVDLSGKIKTIKQNCGSSMMPNFKKGDKGGVGEFGGDGDG